jgi:CRISPR/Cas system-associated exonuclease Cas4 (RecB family)
VIDKSGALIGWAVKLTRVFLTEKLQAGDIITLEHIEEAAKQHAIRKKEAADLGTQVHAWVESYIKAKFARNKKPELPQEERVLNGVIAFLKWEKEHKVKFVASEQIVYSRKHNYVGLADCIAIIDGKKVLIDFKTSNGVYPEFFAQIAAYAMAYNEETKEKIKERYIAKFGKETGEFEVIKDIYKGEDAFLACLTLRRFLDSVDLKTKVW